MPRNGSGTYTRAVSPYVYNTIIDQTAVNSEMDDIASALTASISKDGQTTATANLPMGTFRHTGVGDAAARTDYASAGQVQDSALTWCGTAGGTNNALTFTPAPSVPAYVSGQAFVGIINATSTSAVTLSVSGLPAKDVQINGSALSATLVLEAGKLYQFIFDGTQFQATRLSIAMTAAGLALLDDADTSAQRATLGLVIGTDVQAYDINTAKLDVTQQWTARQDFAASADLASATTIDLTTATGNTAVITGTTATTGFTMNAGQQMLLLPSDAWPITYHATNANINGGASYTCAPGDRVYVAKDLAGVVRVSVIKQDGTALVSSAKSLIAFTKITSSNVAWTPNPATKMMVVRCRGGGGAGGGATLDGYVGGAGQAGACDFQATTSVSGTYTALVAGGGSGSAGNGSPGGASSFVGAGISLYAAGGYGGIVNESIRAISYEGHTGDGIGGARVNYLNGGAAANNSGAGGGGARRSFYISSAGGAGGSGVIYVWEYA